MKLLTCADVARRVGLTTDAVRKAEKRGSLRGLRSEGGVRIFRDADVERWNTRRLAAHAARKSSSDVVKAATP